MSAPMTAARASTVTPGEATIEERLDRIERLLADLAAEARRDRERWQAFDELVRDAGPFVASAMTGARERLQRLEDKGYREVLGASARVLDKVVEEFDADGVEALGDNVLLLLRTMRKMS
jgi:hypothetical protein